MRLAILYEDGEVFVEYTPQEFIDTLQGYIDDGKTVKQATDLMIKELKKRTLTK